MARTENINQHEKKNLSKAAIMFKKAKYYNQKLECNSTDKV